MRSEHVYQKCSLAYLKLGLESLCCRFEGKKRKLIDVTKGENLKISLFTAKNVRVRIREIHCNALYTLQHTENRFFYWVSLQFVDRDILDVKGWSLSLRSLWNQCLPNRETHCDTLQRTATHWVARYKKHTELKHCTTLQHTMTKARREKHFHWCCFYDSIRNSLVILLEALFARSTLYHAATHCNTPPTRDAQERWPLTHRISERERETLAHNKRTLIAFCHVSENLPICCLFYNTMNIHFCFLY